MTWKNEIKELEERKNLAKELGGQDKIERQHKNNRYTIRERISIFFDKNSFREFGILAGESKYDNEILESFIPSNSVIGHGLINDRTIAFYGDDFTVRGGAADASIWQKIIAAEQLANEYEIPLVRFIEGTGGGGSVKSIEKQGFTYVPFNPGWDKVVENLSKIPVISLALGPVAGLGAARLVSSHYSIMLKKNSQVFVAGPPLVEKIGEKVSKEELGGSNIHGTNGVVDEVAENEIEAMEMAKKFLTYVPDSIHDLPKRIKPEDNVTRKDQFLLKIIPKNKRESYDILPIINSVVDKNSLFEIGRKYGLSVITGFARLNGFPIVVIANNPQVYGGGWTSDSSKKIIKIIDLAQVFHFPVLNFVDNPGFIIGKNAEKDGTIKYGAKALAAIYQFKNPMCSIILRKVFGVAGAAHTNHTKFKFRFAWPSADTGSLPFEGGIEAAYKAEINNSSNPEAFIKEKYKKLNRVTSPFRSAEKFLLENIIDPRDTREEVCTWIKLAYKSLKVGPSFFGYRP